jgi:hypothetical protein
MGWMYRRARMGMNVFRIWVQKPAGKQHLGRLGRKNHINMCGNVKDCVEYRTVLQLALNPSPLAISEHTAYLLVRGLARK